MAQGEDLGRLGPNWRGPPTRRSIIPQDMSDRIAQSRVTAMTSLMSGPHADVTIRCRGREIRACKAVICAHSTFFNACFGSASFREGQENVVIMDDDDPDALEASVIYLHTFSTIHIENWNIDEGHYKDGSGQLPSGYAVFVIEVSRLADKYNQDLLAEAVSSFFQSDIPDSQRRIELAHYLLSPHEVIRALVALQTIPDSAYKTNLRYDLYQVIRNNRTISTQNTLDFTDEDENIVDEPFVNDFGREVEALFREHPRVALELLCHYEDEGSYEPDRH